MLLATLVLLAAAQEPISVLPYPVKGSSFELKAEAELTCQVIRLSGSAVDRSFLNGEERVRLDEVTSRIRASWGEADSRQRGRMMIDYMQLGNQGRTAFSQDLVFACGDGPHVRVVKLITPEGRKATMMRELNTDEYLLHVQVPTGSTQEFTRLLFSADGTKVPGRSGVEAPDVVKKRVEDLANRFEKQLETSLDSWDVNGQIFLSQPGADAVEVYTALNAIWDNLSPVAGRSIRVVWGMLEAFDSLELECGRAGGALGASPALDPLYMFSIKPPKLSCEPAEFWMSRPSFVLPLNAPLAEFYGRATWEPVPLDGEFSEAVKWLRSRT